MSMTGKIRVAPLTPALCNRLKADAALALNGDGTCSLRALSTSCFASEACARNAFSSLSLDTMMHSDYKFVALDGPVGTFVGCVTAQKSATDRTVRSLFPAGAVSHRGVVMYNLCVASAYRGCGAGRKLVDAVVHAACAADPHNEVYLLVAKLKRDEPDYACRTLYSERVARLVSMYEHMSFDVIRDCSTHLLMRRRPAAGPRHLIWSR